MINVYLLSILSLLKIPDATDGLQKSSYTETAKEVHKGITLWDFDSMGVTRNSGNNKHICIHFFPI
jgi:hypothetical protein